MGRVIQAIIGLALIGLAIGAALSDEPASKTDQGAIAMTVAVVLGVITLVSAFRKTGPTSPATVQPSPASSGTAPAVPAGGKCPQCSKEISEEYVACPYCGHTLKTRCTACGKELKPNFVVCPFCGNRPQ